MFSSLPVVICMMTSLDVSIPLPCGVDVLWNLIVFVNEQFQNEE